MLRSLTLLFVYMTFMALGTQAPFVLTLGYVWVDTFRPQDVAYLILNQLPVAMIMGALTVGMYLLLDRRSPPRLTLVTVLQLALAAWVTLTCTWAVAPQYAWDKWDWAFKTLIFSAFIPLTIRSRVQIEAFLHVFMLSLAANLIPFGLKMAISGGGYGQNLGLTSGNSGLTEGSTLAAVAIMTIPVCLYLFRHAVLMPRLPLFRLVYIGLAGLAVLTALATFERTALMGLLTLAVVSFIKSRRKLLTLLVGVVVGGIIFLLTSSAWTDRIATINNFNSEGSALGRILVWRWTLGFVGQHPLGGGFNAFIVDHIEFPDGHGRDGIAFHSIYFEVLGEHGWVGLLIFLSILALSLFNLQLASRRARNDPELTWFRDLAAALQVALVVLLVCGAFIGIAFQPMIHYLVAMAVSAAEFLRRTLQAAARPDADKAAAMSWRSRVPAAVVHQEAPVASARWQRT